MVNMPICFVNALSGQNIVDEIAAANDRPVAVRRGAGLVAAGLDHGIQISRKIIGKYVIFHSFSSKNQQKHIVRQHLSILTLL